MAYFHPHMTEYYANAAEPNRDSSAQRKINIILNELLEKKRVEGQITVWKFNNKKL